MDEQHEGCSVVRAEPVIFKVPPNPIHTNSIIAALGSGWILSSSTSMVGSGQAGAVLGGVVPMVGFYPIPVCAWSQVRPKSWRRCGCRGSVRTRRTK